MATFTRAAKNAALDEHNAKLMARMARDAGPEQVANSAKILSRIGDEKQLRGIPCQAMGVGGTINGTDPVAVLMAKQPKD